MVAAQQSAPSPNRARPPDGRRRYESLTREHGFEAMRVEGALPPELRGTLYRNGPSLTSLFGVDYTHPFEADGAISAVRIAGGRAEGALRLIESEGLREERAAGRMLYGLRLPWRHRILNALRGRRKNAANTSVLRWQERLFALFEVDLATEFDPETLTTIGATDFGGVVPSAMSAHPHAVASLNTQFHFGARYSRESFIDLFELPTRGPARRLASVPLKAPVMLHDFIATERHLVFFVSPARVRVLRALLQLGHLEQLFAWRPELGTEIVVVPLNDLDRPRRFTVDPFFQFHFANAFERGDGTIAVDYVRYPDLGILRALGQQAEVTVQSRLHRAIVDPARESFETRALLGESCEFPQVDPRRAGARWRYTWMQAPGPPQAILRLDHEDGTEDRWSLPATRWASEPVVVPRPGSTREGDAHVLTLIYDAETHQSGVSVLDAMNLAAGPVATAWFDHHIPTTYHGVWVPRDAG